MLMQAVNRSKYQLALAALLMATVAPLGLAQSTAFTYQGRLTDAGNPANGVYDLQFKLFDSANAQQGPTLMRDDVAVANGVFSVLLDFGNVFDGGPRQLEIGVRPGSSTGAFTVLSPNQPITSTPYAIRSLTASNALQLGGVAASGFIQNTATQQTADFNISGNGAIGGNLTVGGTLSLNVVNALTQYNLGGRRILSNAGSFNLFVGEDAGRDNTTGIYNSFFGYRAGIKNTLGEGNTFVGSQAGQNNESAHLNTFVGAVAGLLNTSGSSNSFFGARAGESNATGNDNAFFGRHAGLNNTASDNSFFGSEAGYSNQSGTNNAFFGRSAGRANTSSSNSFFGAFAGQNNTIGNSNAFFGTNAGQSNTEGFQNSFFGKDAGKANVGGFNNTFVGMSAGLNTTNGTANSFFGAAAGVNNINGSRNTFFGEISGNAVTSGGDNAFFGSSAGFDTANNIGVTTGSRNTSVGFASGKAVVTGSDNTFVGSHTTGASDLTFASAFGAGAVVSSSNTLVLGRSADTVQIPGNLTLAGNLTGGNIVRNLNGLTGNVTLAAGANVTITPAGNTLTIAATGGSGNFILNTTTPQAGANFNIGGNGTVGGALMAGALNGNGALTLGGIAPPSVAPAGQGRLYFDATSNKLRVSENGGAFVNLVGATGVSGSGTASTIPLWSAGTTLGNSVITQSGAGNIAVGAGTAAHRLAALGGPCWTGDCWGGALELDNSAAIGWRQNTAGVKFGIGRTEGGLFFFRTNSPLGTTTNAPMYDFKLDNSGNVGIGNLGIGTDLSGAKLTAFTNSAAYGLVQSDGTTTVGTYVGASGGWLGTRSNHPLHFFTNNGSPQMTLLTSGYLGIGTTTPATNLHIRRSYSLLTLESANPDSLAAIDYVTSGQGGRTWRTSGDSALSPINGYQIRDLTAGQTRLVIDTSGNVGIGTTGPQRLLHVNGQARIGVIPPGGSFSNQVCFTAEGDLLQCTSSLRYKTNVQPFLGGLKIIRQLRPITFNWKENGQSDIGLGAEDLAQVAPEFVSWNAKGETVSVNYAGLSALFINAFKEQQDQLEQQRTQLNAQAEQLSQQQAVIRQLKLLVCADHPQTALCQPARR